MASTAQATVITVSDSRALHGSAEPDTAGDAAAERLRDLAIAPIRRLLVADDPVQLGAALRDAAMASHLVVITGGTGLGPRDLTPQTVAPLLDYEVPGIAEAMRAAGMQATPRAMLSRQLAGVMGRCLVLVLPGSERGVRQSLEAVVPALGHALETLAGGGDH